MKFFILFLSFISILISGCAKSKVNYLKENIAEFREFVFEGEKDGVEVSLICGMRETEYVINGYATEPKEFGVLSFTVQNIDNYDVSLATYVLTINSTRYDGKLIQNPFNKSLVVDIGKVVDKDANINAKIMIGEYIREVNLNLIGKDFKINANNALEIFADTYKDEINSLIDNGVFKGEVYLKLINDEDQNISDYYWYVNLVNRNNKNFSLILSPYSGEVLAKSNGNN